MPDFTTGKVVSVEADRRGLVNVGVDIDGEVCPAVGFLDSLGPVEVDDRVVVNVTGIELELGTGGVGFVLWNLDGPGPPGHGHGHIMKMRYTPWQREVLAAEAPESPHHATLADLESLEGMPVVVCGLHSQIAGVAAGIKEAAPGVRIGYLMTDGAALPLNWSNLVADLQAERLIDVTASAGHAFGGDLEVINVHSGLVALRSAGDAGVVIVAMGPGIVGTSTRLGFTGMEQGQVLDAATSLGGTSIACLRISFIEGRDRHRGVSHHTLTALRVAAREPATVVVPRMSPERLSLVYSQLQNEGIDAKHRLVEASGDEGVDRLRSSGISVTSMGREMDEVAELFVAAAAAGAVAGATGSVPQR
jgi:hypothetical protein